MAALAGSSCSVVEGPAPSRRAKPGAAAVDRVRAAGAVEATVAAPAARAPASGAARPAVAAPEVTDDAAERAARLGLGTHTTAVYLFVGPVPEAWVSEAGGAEPPRALRWPLDGGRFMRGYGEEGGKHRGIDVGDDPGAPIRAAAEGLVAYAGSELSGYGKVIVVVHPAGWVTLYGHASELVARPGQLVAPGDLIARVGHTGNAGGDHLHFELRRDGHKVNPLPFLHGAPTRVRSTEPLALPQRFRVHLVKQSDRLFRVARGSGMRLADLAALNGLDPRDVLSVGHRLLIARKPRGAHRP